METKPTLKDAASGILGMASSRSGIGFGSGIAAILSIADATPWMPAAKIAGIVCLGVAYIWQRGTINGQELATKPGYDPANGKVDPSDGETK